MVTARSEGADIVEASASAPTTMSPSRSTFPVALARIGTHLSHKRAVEDLHESEERYALAVRGRQRRTLGLESGHATRSIGRRAGKRMLGYDEAAIGVSPDEWLTRVHPEDAARVKAR